MFNVSRREEIVEDIIINVNLSTLIRKRMIMLIPMSTFLKRLTIN